MLKTIALIVVVAIAAVLIFATTKPDSFSLQRSATIDASPDKLFALISDVKAFNTWNPFALKDPESKLSYGDKTIGPGAAYAWQGGSSGAGRMEIIEAQAPSKVAMRLDFEQPMKTTNRIEFTLVPRDSSTEVTWAMSGPMPYLSKLITTFVSMDKMVGSEFESGLANLKKAAEGR